MLFLFFFFLLFFPWLSLHFFLVFFFFWFYFVSHRKASICWHLRCVTPPTGKKIRDSHFRVFKEYPQKCQIWKSETSPKQGTWLGIPLLRLVSLCQIWDLYGFSLKYPKISNNGNLLFFSCVNGSMLQPSSHSENLGYLEIHTGVYWLWNCEGHKCLGTFVKEKVNNLICCYEIWVFYHLCKLVSLSLRQTFQLLWGNALYCCLHFHDFIARPLAWALYCVKS